MPGEFCQSELGKVEQWLQGMDKIFNTLGWEVQYKKRLAVFLLAYSTVKWCEAKKATSGEEVIGRLSWVHFKTKFLGKYFPNLQKDKKEKEFIDLMQRTRSM